MEPREPKGAIGPEIYAGQGVEVKGFVMRRQGGGRAMKGVRSQVWSSTELPSDQTWCRGADIVEHRDN